MTPLRRDATLLPHLQRNSACSVPVKRLSAEPKFPRKPFASLNPSPSAAPVDSGGHVDGEQSERCAIRGSDAGLTQAPDRSRRLVALIPGARHPHHNYLKVLLMIAATPDANTPKTSSPRAFWLCCSARRRWSASACPLPRRRDRQHGPGRLLPIGSRTAIGCSVACLWPATW